jgi:hypothetical protein
VNSVKQNVAGIYGTHDDSDIVLHDAQEVVYTTTEAASPPDAWRHVFRYGLLWQITTEGLQALWEALQRNDPRVIRGQTTSPPSLHCCADLPVEACCVLCWLLLKGDRPEAASVGLLESAFYRTCWACDERLGEPWAIRRFLNFCDCEPWTVVRRELLAELDWALQQRQQQQPSPLVRQLEASIALVQKGGGQ